MEDESRQLRFAVTEILRTLELPSLDRFKNGIPRKSISEQRQLDVGRRVSTATPGSLPERLPGVRFLSELPSPNTSRDSRRYNHAAGMAMTRENSQEMPNEDDGALVSAPMGTLFEVTKLRNLRSNPRGQQSSLMTSIEDDFISTGEVDLAEAERLFDVFNRSLNHYLWGGIALVHDNLTSVRKSSSLLSAAILTVTALHVPGMENMFDTCYAEFVSLVCASMLDRYHNLDGIRALAIGAFWLSDLSWKLSGHAVRIATELNLHQSFAKAMKGSRDHFEGARLWYFLYVCDHHFSIAYGRPPVIHEDHTIVHHEEFLRLQQIDQADLRLHSQVSVFRILTEMYFAFGPDIELRLGEDDLHRIRHFNVRLDSWRVKWEQRLTPNLHIASYPAKGVGLHYHYAKLQLNALALRGYQPMASYELSTDRRECANIAISCAETILRFVLDEPDIRNGLVGVPLYLHTMITFAVTFLLKVHQRWKSAQLGTDLAMIQRLVVRVISLLREVKASERHITYHIATGLSKMLDRFMAWEKHEVAALATQMAPTGHQPGLSQPYPPVAAPVGQFDMNYGNMPLYSGDVMQLYDENYFPAGFFDVLSSAMPE